MVFAAAAICQTLRLRAMGRQVDALTAQTADQQQQLDSLQQQLAEAQAAREAAEAEAQGRPAQRRAGPRRRGQGRHCRRRPDRPRVGGGHPGGLPAVLGRHRQPVPQRRGGPIPTDGCVLPGENGTVFVGGHTDSLFVDLKSAQIGGIIHLETPWGTFSYQITETKVIGETEIDQCRWGAEEPSCILYTCYPFGIQTPTTQRYLVYADPIETDAGGVVPDELRTAES